MAELIDKNLLMEELHSIFEGDADLRKDYEYMGIDDYIRSMPITTEAEIRAKAIADAIEASAKAICIGCGYLDGHSCTYKGSNCGVSKPMLGVVVKALEKLKGE